MRCAGQPLAAIAASRYALGADGMGALRARAPAAARSRPRAARSAPMAWARPPPPGDEAIATTTRGVGVDAATASEPRHAWGPVEDATARREPHRTAQVRRSSDQRTACGANHLVEGGKLCTSTKQAGCLIPDLLDLRVHERLGWLGCYPASIFDTYAATAKRTTRSRMIMTFASVCEWSNTCRVDAQRLRLKPRDRLTTENVPCTRQPRTRKGWGARASDSIVPRSEMARRSGRGTLSRGAPRTGSKKERAVA